MPNLFVPALAVYSTTMVGIVLAGITAEANTAALLCWVAALTLPAPNTVFRIDCTLPSPAAAGLMAIGRVFSARTGTAWATPTESAAMPRQVATNCLIILCSGSVLFVLRVIRCRYRAKLLNR